MSAWQPIETAPTDGTRVLAVVRGWDKELSRPKPLVLALFYSRCRWLPDGGGWTMLIIGEDTRQEHPTHWMALPDPPTEWLSDFNARRHELGNE